MYSNSKRILKLKRNIWSICLYAWCVRLSACFSNECVTAKRNSLICVYVERGICFGGAYLNHLCYAVFCLKIHIKRHNDTKIAWTWLTGFTCSCQVFPTYSNHLFFSASLQTLHVELHIITFISIQYFQTEILFSSFLCFILY